MKAAIPPASPPTMEAPPPYAPTEEERSTSDASSSNLRPSQSHRQRPGALGVVGHRGSGDACCSVDSGSGCMNIRSEDGWYVQRAHHVYISRTLILSLHLA